MPHGCGYLISLQENVGLAAIWSVQGVPTGVAVCLNQDGIKMETTYVDGIKHGIEFGE